MSIMPKFRTRRTRTVEAARWRKNGDHPLDACRTITSPSGESSLSEGEVVRRWRHPSFPGTIPCSTCGQPMHVHGWLKDSNTTVCPGDWVVTENGATYPMRDAAFRDEFEPVQD